MTGASRIHKKLDNEPPSYVGSTLASRRRSRATPRNTGLDVREVSPRIRESSIPATMRRSSPLLGLNHPKRRLPSRIPIGPRGILRAQCRIVVHHHGTEAIHRCRRLNRYHARRFLHPTCQGLPIKHRAIRPLRTRTGRHRDRFPIASLIPPPAVYVFLHQGAPLPASTRIRGVISRIIIPTSYTRGLIPPLIHRPPRNPAFASDLRRLVLRPGRRPGRIVSHPGKKHESDTKQ